MAGGGGEVKEVLSRGAKGIEHYRKLTPGGLKGMISPTRGKPADQTASKSSFFSSVKGNGKDFSEKTPGVHANCSRSSGEILTLGFGVAWGQLLTENKGGQRPITLG